MRMYSVQLMVPTTLALLYMHESTWCQSPRSMCLLLQENSKTREGGPGIQYRHMRSFHDFERVIPQQPMAACLGIYANNKHVPRLALDAPLAVTADALAAYAVSVATGCPQDVLMQAAFSRG